MADMVGTVADMAGMAHTASTVADMVDTVADMVDMVAGLDIVDNPDFMGTTDSVNMEDMEEAVSLVIEITNLKFFEHTLPTFTEHFHAKRWNHASMEAGNTERRMSAFWDAAT
uniref:Uncharacterized protein n=1 Tax=Parascaris equorum TaxID=6256 RepID=A0A914S601_PAREQ